MILRGKCQVLDRRGDRPPGETPHCIHVSARKVSAFQKIRMLVGDVYSVSTQGIDVGHMSERVKFICGTAAEAAVHNKRAKYFMDRTLTVC